MFTGKTFVVTGGSMGIGYACAAELVRRHARVVVVARGRAALDGAMASLTREVAGAEVRAVPADVTDARAFERVLDEAEALGGFEGLVHAAAVLGPINRAVDVEPDEWLETIRLNLFGSFVAARATCRRLARGGRGGSVVLFSGGGGTGPFPRYTAYACGKVGVVRLAETLAQEVAGDGIRVNCVAPGFVVTRMHEQTLAAGEAAGHDYLERTKREIEAGGVSPELAARTVAFLLSPQAAGITGRLVAAPWDDWEHWPDHVGEIEGSDLFTLRRIVPKDRGKDWQ